MIACNGIVASSLRSPGLMPCPDAERRSPAAAASSAWPSSAFTAPRERWRVTPVSHRGASFALSGPFTTPQNPLLSAYPAHHYLSRLI